MHEDGAAVAPDARALVVVEHHDEVIEPVLAPQVFGVGRVGMADGAVVIAVGRGIAPAVVALDRRHRQAGRESWTPFGAPEDPDQPEAADWRRAIALAFHSTAPAAAERTGATEPAQMEDASGCRRAQRAHDQL